MDFPRLIIAVMASKGLRKAEELVIDLITGVMEGMVISTEKNTKLAQV